MIATAALLLLVAGAGAGAPPAPTPTPTATPQPTPSPTPGPAPTAVPRSGQSIYGNRLPIQLEAMDPNRPTPTPEPLSGLAAIAARTKLRADRKGPGALTISNRGGGAAAPASGQKADRRRGDAVAHRIEVVAYERSGNVEMYFVLQDQAGKEIAVDGTAYLYVSFRFPPTVMRTVDVKRSQFEVASVGRGVFQRDRLLFPLGIVTAEDVGVTALHNCHATVEVRFSQAMGPTVTDSDDVYVD